MSEGIAYQNKDILFKILGQTYKEKSFAAYGIDLPPIKELLPPSLPKISANEKDIDNLFLLEDGTYAIVDYESEFKKLNKIKYLNYIARVMEKYYKEDETFNLRLIVIYTGDVKSAEPVYETSCFTLRMEQAFLSHIDGETAFESISQKLRSNTPLEDDDLMKLVILPLTMPGIEGKQKMLEKVVDLAEQVTDSRQQIFILSGVIVASDKFINREYLEQIRRRINMTQLGQLYEKEKIEYANKKNRELTVEMAKSMLDEGIDFVKIMKVTGLTEDELLRLQDEAVTVYQKELTLLIKGQRFLSLITISRHFSKGDILISVLPPVHPASVPAVLPDTIPLPFPHEPVPIHHLTETQILLHNGFLHNPSYAHSHLSSQNYTCRIPCHNIMFPASYESSCKMFYIE